MHGRRRHGRTLAPAWPSLLAGTLAAWAAWAAAGTWPAAATTFPSSVSAPPSAIAAWARCPPSTAAALGAPAVLTVLVAPPGPLPRRRRQDHRDVRRPLRRADDLNAPGRRLRCPGRLHRGQRQDLNAFQPGLDFGPQHGAHRLTARHERTVDCSFRLACTGGAPRPGAVRCLARQ